MAKNSQLEKGFLIASSKEDERVTLAGWYKLAILFLLCTVSYMDRTALSLVVTPIKAELHLSDFQVSLLMGTAFAIPYALTGIPFGYIADRANRRNLIVIGVSVWSFMTGAAGFAQSFWSLYVARFGVGVGEAALNPAAYSTIADTFPLRRIGLAVSLYTIGIPVGLGLSWIIGGALLDLATQLSKGSLYLLSGLASWRILLIFLCIPGLILAGLMFCTSEPARRSIVDDRLLGGKAVGENLWIFMWRRKSLVVPYFGGQALFAMTVYGFNAWAPAMLERKFGISPTLAAPILGSLQVLGGGAAVLASGFIADVLFRKIGPKAYLRVIISASVMTGVCYSLAPLAPTHHLAYLGIGGGIISQGLQGGLPVAVIYQFAPVELRARVIACYFTLLALVGLGLGPMAVVVANNIFFAGKSLAGGLAITAAGCMTCAVAMLVLYMRESQKATVGIGHHE